MTRIAPLLALSALVLAPNATDARIPSPANSEVPRCIVIDPAGHFVFHAIVRDIGGTAIPDAAVTIDFCQCADVQLCPPLDTDPYTIANDCVVRQATDANGEVWIPIRGGGTCPSGLVEVRATGVLLQVSFIASPDQDGNLVVDLVVDGAILNDKLLTDPSNRTGDLDCSLVIDANDLAVQAAHAGEMCEMPTQTTRETWGRVKGFYR